VAVTVEGIVREILPRALYRIEIDGGREVTAHAGSDVRKNFIRLLVNDRVRVSLTSRDDKRGRVLKKL
jgi:translation initiation factor IF-1